MAFINQFLHLCVEYANWLTLGLGLLFTILSLFFSKKHQSEQLRSYVPTIWTSLGIFFTFLSIYVTLKDYASLPDDLITMGGIIKGIIPAFSTSVIGILFAIITAYSDRLKKSRGEARDNDGFVKFSNGEVSAKGVAQTPDIILLELVREIGNYIVETHRRIDSLSENLLNSINQKGELLQEELRAHKADTIKGFVDTLKEQNQQLKDYVQSFVSVANKTHEEQISALLTGFTKDSQEREEKHREEMRELKTDAQNYIKLIEENLCKEAATRQDKIEKFLLDETENRNSFVKAQNDELSATLNLARETINNAVKAISELFEKQIKQDIEAFAKTQHEECLGIINDEFKSFKENSEWVLAKQEDENASFLDTISGALKEAHSSITSDIGVLKEAILLHLNSLFADNQGALAGIIKQHTDDFGVISESIQGAFDKEKDFINTASQEMERNHTSILESYKKELSKTASSMSETAEAMSNSLVGFCSSLQEKAESLETEHLQTIEGIQRAGEDTIKKVLESQVERIDEAIKMYKTELEELSSTIKDTGRQMADKIEQFCRDLDERTDKIEKDHLDIVAGIHTQGEERIKEALSGFKKQLEELSNTISGTGESMVNDMKLFCSNLDTRTEELEKEHLNKVKDIHIQGDKQIKEANDHLAKDISALIITIQQLQSSVQSSSQDYVQKHDAIKQQIAGTTNLLIKEISGFVKDSTQIEALERTCKSLNEKLSETVSALDNKYHTISESLETVATSIEAYSHVADDTKTLNKFVNSTLELYKSHSTKMELLESSLKEMTTLIVNAVESIKKSSPGAQIEAKARPKKNNK